MRRLALLVAALLAAAGCSTSPCQELGEKLCACTGLNSESCTKQVEDQLKSIAVDDERCDVVLDGCNDRKPEGAEFCAWLKTETGKQACGMAPFAQ